MGNLVLDKVGAYADQETVPYILSSQPTPPLCL